MSKKQFHPKVSIIIPVYNGSNYLREAIDSALAQTYDNFEVIVVNDGSNDNGKTEKICKSYGNKIRYIKKENGGVASALNRGIKEMKGEYFSWLSHDDVYYPDKLEKQINFLETQEDKKVIVYSNVENIDKNSKTIYETQHQKWHNIKYLNTRLYPVLKGLMNGCALLIHKNILVKAGYFDETLKTANDYAMWFKITRINNVRFLSKTLIKRRIHEEQGTKKEKRYCEESNNLWKSIISDIKPREIKKFESSLLKFYIDMYIQMKRSKYFLASQTAVKLAQKYYDPENLKVSIIMATYNTEDYICEAIDSILEQTFPNFEFIIVDDNSSDNTFSIIKDYAKKDFRIKFTKNKYEKGVAGAINTGLDLSKGEYITRMDSDDISLPTRIEKQVNFLEKNPTYDLFSVNLITFGEQPNQIIYKKHKPPYEWLFLWENPVPNPTIMYRSKLIKDKKIRLNSKYIVASDYDFFCRMILKGKLFFSDEVLLRYRVHSKSLFQKHIKEAGRISLEINANFIKQFTKKEIPNFHKYLTIFYKKPQNKEISLIKALRWMDLLLNKMKEYYNWSEKEIELIEADINERIKSLILTDEIKRKINYNEELTKEIKRIKNSKSWKLTKPMRYLSHKFRVLYRKLKTILNLPTS
jgi:glycosyltransferase involved in cell wall biosynthesis